MELFINQIGKPGAFLIRCAVTPVLKHLSSVSRLSAPQGLACRESPIPRKPPLVSTAYASATHVEQDLRNFANLRPREEFQGR